MNEEKKMLVKYYKIFGILLGVNFIFSRFLPSIQFFISIAIMVLVVVILLKGKNVDYNKVPIIVYLSLNVIVTLFGLLTSPEIGMLSNVSLDTIMIILGILSIAAIVDLFFIIKVYYKLKLEADQSESNLND